MSEKTEQAAIYVDPKELKPWANNPRKNDKAVKKVAASILKLGFGAPIVANKNGEIIAGHTRWKAALGLRLEKIPVRFMDLTDEEAHAMALADNKLGEIAEWDEEALGKALKETSQEFIDVSGFGEGREDELDFSEAAIEESEGLEPEFYVIFRGPLHLQADIIGRLQKISDEYDGVRIEPGI